MAPAAYPWTLRLKALLELALADAVAAGYFADKTGAVYNYDEWPAAVIVQPTILIGFLGGDQTYGMSSPAIAHETAKVWIFFPKFTLAIAQASSYPLVKFIRNRLAKNITLDYTVEHCLPPDPPELFFEGPGQIQYATQDQIGIILTLDVKLNETGQFEVSAIPAS